MNRARSERDRGMATVTALVAMFAFTAVALVWLATDVNRRVAARSTAQSIAFQSARAGAQQITGYRQTGSEALELDPERAERAARTVADSLVDASSDVTRADDGPAWFVAAVDVGRDELRVTVRLRGADGQIVTGVGAARAVVGGSPEAGVAP